MVVATMAGASVTDMAGVLVMVDVATVAADGATVAADTVAVATGNFLL
jgi:hypothetical protein